MASQNPLMFLIFSLMMVSNKSFMNFFALLLQSKQIILNQTKYLYLNKFKVNFFFAKICFGNTFNEQKMFVIF